MRSLLTQHQKLLWHTVLLNVLLAVVYLGAAKLGLQFAVVQGNATLIWIPTGLSLAAVLLGGYTMLPGVAIGALLTVATTPVPLWVAFAASAGNTLEAFFGAYALRRFARFDISLRRLRDVWSLLVWAALLSTVASATIGVSSLCAAGAASWALFPRVWLIWWLGNVMGDLLVAPLLLVWSRLPRWSAKQWTEFALLLLLTSLVALTVFGGWLVPPHVPPYPLAFTVFPLLIWATLRFEQHGGTAANGVSASIAAWMTVTRHGPFSSYGLQESLTLLWLFMAVITVPVLLLAASLSERRMAEEALQEAHAQVYEIINNAPGVAVQGYDLQGRVRLWNKASETLYGFSEQEVLGKRLGEFLLSEEDAKEFERMLQQIAQTGRPAPLREWETKTASGAPRYILSSLFPIELGPDQVQVVCMDLDITERKRLEATLLRTQRLDSIGRLAGGIAHDFNNLLTTIMAHADMALAKWPEGHPAAVDIEHIIDSANRAADLVRQLLAFARRQALASQMVNLNELLVQVTPLLQRLVGKHLEMNVNTEPALKQVRADPTQLEQVIVNLVLNARDAMPEGGVLTIRAANIVQDDASAHMVPDLPPGEYVMLEVSDTGVGIPAENVEHIFEPFFTTKGEQGTGLGLAVVYGVIKQSGGSITVESTPGQGTTFRIYLPAVPETAQ